jgi:hypothetical protein
MRSSDPPVALVYESEDICLILHLEPAKDWVFGLGLLRGKEFSLEPFGM